MMQNALSYAPKKRMIDPIVEAMREIFNARNLIESRKRVKEAVINLSNSAPEFVEWLENNIEDGLTCFEFPKKHRKRIRTSNSLERVNREVKRGTRVAVLFPNSQSALRLVTGVLIEIHEEWITGKMYLDMGTSKEEYLNHELKVEESQAVRGRESRLLAAGLFLSHRLVPPAGKK